jgi:hypothetical protein
LPKVLVQLLLTFVTTGDSLDIQSINQIQQLVTKHTIYLITHDCISKGNLCTYIKTNTSVQLLLTFVTTGDSLAPYKLKRCFSNKIRSIAIWWSRVHLVSHTIYLITHDCISKGNLCTYIKTNTSTQNTTYYHNIKDNMNSTIAASM